MSKVKIKLGTTPKSFAPATVKFTTPGGEAAEIVVTYKYRTRSQFAEFLDAIHKSAGLETPKVDQVDFSALFEKSTNKNVDQLLDCVEVWDLEDPLNRENLQRLADELPAAAIALMAGYSAACAEGRLGN